MKYLPPLIITLSLMVAGCAASHAPIPETRACMKYRTMMTAPLSPDAAAALRQQCEQSRQ
ncbi:hypothetical protein [Citrobacter sp. JGM124]|uniref:hypothetical protein n=1 Tax=Citrobacter sp. JGM124 TaxID=2799789 RepID=UPI001BAA2E77|nr:hypothetical protein [Citrobacter sp. JGM124]MBS0847400.1 hypothetical protein [Citrobacter sp. JGM124]